MIRYSLLEKRNELLLLKLYFTLGSCFFLPPFPFPPLQSHATPNRVKHRGVVGPSPPAKKRDSQKSQGCWLCEKVNWARWRRRCCVGASCLSMCASRRTEKEPNAICENALALPLPVQFQLFLRSSSLRPILACPPGKRQVLFGGTPALYFFDEESGTSMHATTTTAAEPTEKVLNSSAAKAVVFSRH